MNGDQPAIEFPTNSLDSGLSHIPRLVSSRGLAILTSANPGARVTIVYNCGRSGGQKAKRPITFNIREMSRYGCKQHDDFKNATYRRRHLNLLLDDYIKELDNIYGRKPAHSDAAPEAEVIAEPQSECKPAAKGKSAATALALASEDALKVNNKRSPTGNFFQVVNPALSREDPHIGYSAEAYITKEALEVSGRIPAGLPEPSADAAHPSTAVAEAEAGRAPPQAAAAEEEVAAGAETTAGAVRSWHMPWQTGDRKTGREMARAICSKRTPIGAFANRDLAKPLIARR